MKITATALALAAVVLAGFCLQTGDLRYGMAAIVFAILNQTEVTGR